MRCKEIQEQFAEYLSGMLVMPAGVMDHLNGCTSCRTQFEELRNLWSELGNIPVPASDSSATRLAVAAAVAALKTEVHQNATEAAPSVWLPAGLINRRKDMRPTIRAIFAIIVVATLAAGAGLLLHREPEVAVTFTGPQPIARQASGNVRGLANAPFTLVEYGDYECPPCAVSHRIVKELLEKYPERVNYEFRPFPLTAIHPTAMRAAVAAQAAADQGKYWEMHDALFEIQKTKRAPLNEAQLIEMAKSLGLDAAQFMRSTETHEAELKIQKAMDAARAAGVESVPTFFLNGKKVEGFPMTLEGFLGLMQPESGLRK
jgi:protein-disulfide isomerase